jgi:hypothetical protein
MSQALKKKVFIQVAESQNAGLALGAAGSRASVVCLQALFAQILASF